MPPTSQPLTYEGYLRSAPEEAREECSSQVGDRKGRKKKVVCAAGALHPLYRLTHAWRIDRNRRGEFPMRGGSYLIHSPRVLPTPRGDYFTADGGIEHDGYKGGRTDGEDNAGTAHTTLRKSMSRPSVGRSKQIVSDRVSLQVSPLGIRARWHFPTIHRRVTCLRHRNGSGANEIIIFYSFYQHLQMSHLDLRLML